MIEVSVVILALTGFLIVATLGARWALRKDPADPAAKDLMARVESWWAMGAVFGLAMLAGFWGVLILCFFISFAALREFVTIAHRQRTDHWAWAAIVFAALPMQYVFVGFGWRPVFSVFLPIFGFLAVPAIVALQGRTENFLARTAEMQAAVMIAIYGVSHVPALLTLDIPGYEGRGILLVAYLVVVVQGADILQYLVGKVVPGRAIAPSLSMSRTREGFVVGSVAAAALGATFAWYTPFAPHWAALLALVAVWTGFAGSLIMTAIKRDKGVRDWSHAIAGHGGFLDRTDSVIFAAPVFYQLVRLGYAA